MSKPTPLKVAGLHGDKLYQQRARVLLPLLVRQARMRTPITYQALAHEAGIPRGRVMNYPLGCIGRTVQELSARLGPIPQLEAIVVNAKTGMPGPGIDGFFPGALKSATPQRRRAVILAAQQEVFDYPHWDRVLQLCRLPPADPKIAALIDRAAKRGRGGRGEGDAHRHLKLAIARKPALVGLEGETAIEYALPSGDKVDVLVRTRKATVAVEVKPEGAPDADVMRGLFQCVKYRAVINAQRAAQGEHPNADVRLALGGLFPAALLGLCNALSVTVVDRVATKPRRLPSTPNKRTR